MSKPVPDIKVDWIGGECPVQAEGTVNGKPFYFRARGDAWSMEILGGNPLSPEWTYEELYGVWPDAGYMTEDEAREFIHKAACRYLNETDR